MDQTEVQEIKNSNDIIAANGVIPENVEGVVFAPDNFKKHDLEELMPNRRNYRGNFSTSIIDEFANYVKEEIQQGTTCFVNHDNMSAKAVFDLLVDNLPGHGQHTAKVTLVATPEFSDLLSINGNPKSQQAMAEFIEDHIDFMSFYDADNNEIPRTKAITAIRKIDIEAVSKSSSDVGDYHAERSAMETVKASSEHGLPSNIVYTCVPYESLEPYQLECRLSISSSGSNVNLRLTIRSLEMAKAKMAKEFAEKIISKLPNDGITIYRGNFVY